MAVFATIEELKTAINDTIYANDAGLITAEIMQERLHDIIDTLNSISTSVAGVKAYLEANNDLEHIFAGNDEVATEAWVALQEFATLDENGKVPATQLPSYVDDVLEYANFAALPGIGEAGIIYVTLNTNLTYRWSGSAYIEISVSLALGETSATAYRGDRGKTAYDHTSLTNNPHNVTAGQAGAETANANIQSHISSTLNPHGVTAAQAGALASGATAVGAAKLLTTNFTIEEVGVELVIKYGTTIILKITSAGYLKAKDELEPFAAM